MRISSPRLYRKLCTENKLPLPHFRTLRRYMKNISPTYGSNEKYFGSSCCKSRQLFRARTTRENKMVNNRVLCLLLDEMGLDENTNDDPNTKQFVGLVNLGKYTKVADKTKAGNHALGSDRWSIYESWCCPGRDPPKIIVEAIGLIEKAGFKVDVVTTDGATWNRAMWKSFGVIMDENSCEHPVDSTRQLMFASDFPHLVKGLWTWVLNKKQLNTPDGLVNIHHWKVLYVNEAKLGIEGNFTITEGSSATNKLPKNECKTSNA
ncbi:DNA transposase, partial [Frankliniella fusca]